MHFLPSTSPPCARTIEEMAAKCQWRIVRKPFAVQCRRLLKLESAMLRLSHLHAGMVVFRRHFRHALRDPRRIYWIFRRIVDIVRAGALGSVLERHAELEGLYADYAAWIDRYDTLTPDERAALQA